MGCETTLARPQGALGASHDADGSCSCRMLRVHAQIISLLHLLFAIAASPPIQSSLDVPPSPVMASSSAVAPLDAVKATQALGRKYAATARSATVPPAPTADPAKATAAALFAETFCPVRTTYTTKAGDDGKRLARVFFPRAPVVEMWGWVVSCNTNLQELYAGSTTPQFNLPPGLTLDIPDFLKAASATAAHNAAVAATVAATSPAGTPADAPARCGCSGPITVTRTTPLIQAVKTWFKDSSVLVAAAEVLRCNPTLKLVNGNVAASQTLQGVCLDLDHNTTVPAGLVLPDAPPALLSATPGGPQAGRCTAAPCLRFLYRTTERVTSVGAIRVEGPTHLHFAW